MFRRPRQANATHACTTRPRCRSCARKGVAPLLLVTCALLADPSSAVAQTPSSCGPSTLGAPCPPNGLPISINPAVGNPVHLATGNKYLYALDVPAHPAARGLVVERHYNARDVRTSVLGPGWQHGYSTALYVRAGRVNLVEPDGSRHVFVCTAAACHGPSTSGTLHRLSADDGLCPQSAWRWTQQRAKSLCFDARGTLQSIDVQGGERVSITRYRDGAFHGLIKRIDQGPSFSLHWHYRETTDGPRLERIATPVGDIRYRYAAQSSSGRTQLQDMQRPDGLGRFYVYEPAHQGPNTASLTGMGMTLGAPANRIRTHTWRYDATGRVVGMSWGNDTSGTAMTIDYAAPDGSQTSTTRVNTAQGATRFTFARRSDRYALVAVEGVGCPGCAAPGLRADYDEAGDLTTMGGLSLRYHPNRIIRQLRPDAKGWPRLNMRFDAQARLTAWTFDDARPETRQYLHAGRVIKRTFADGTTWVRTDQPAQTLLSMRNADDSLAVTIRWAQDRPIEIVHPNEHETRRYDAQGRLSDRTIVRTRQGASASDASEASPTKTYPPLRDRFERDDSGRIIRHWLPEGGSLRYAWSQTNRVTHITWQDDKGNVRALLSSDARPGYTLANGVKVQALMRNGQLVALTVAPPQADATCVSAPEHCQTRPPHHDGPLWGQFLSYDARGNISGERWLMPSPDTAMPATLAYQLEYDSLNRMVGVLHSAAAPVAASDTTPRWAGSGWNDAAPRMTRGAGALPTRYGGRQLKYGPDRRLKQVAEGANVLAQYAHNAWGERIWRQAEDGEQYFLFDGSRLVAEARPQSDTLSIYRRYIYAAGVPVALLDYTPNGPTAVHTVIADSLGAPWLVLDDTAHVTWQAVLSPTGQAQILRAEQDQPLRLPGQWLDAATGWHDNYLRTYDPAYGHFLEPDPLGPLPDSQAYGYAAQQPRRYVDPTGLLLFAFDGTQRTLASDTNVARFVRTYDGIAHYAAGPGTADRFDLDAATAHSAPAILLMQWERFIGALRDAPAAHHAIDIVGFSRGAALGRAFGNRIAAQLTNGRFNWQDAAGAVISACVNLRFMGLFDTVKRFGILGANDDYYDTRIAAQWQWVAHAVALHERRSQFPLSTIGAVGATRQEHAFVGAHSDIGGGYLIEEAAPEAPPRGSLAAVSLAWMRWQARAAGVPLADADEEIKGEQATLHDERIPLSRRWHIDRPVIAPDAETATAHQARHPRFGRAMREEVESFITRNRDWLTDPDNAVGQVDMPRYLRWLRDLLGGMRNQIKPGGAFHAIIGG